ncbi:UPF0280 family protein [Neotabrizicola sp. VNH66]|uniref:UPF0280 family protein n=1 Tax=Neotabrizicola sp. VNH66 TaxID=3400918 RepID=UPI003C0BC623
MTAIAALLPDGRLHLQHGPIDILVGLKGSRDAISAAQTRAVQRFSTVLDELVEELPLLRSPLGQPQCRIARRMAAAVAPYRPAFITPMAAVAGAVAEEIAGVLPGPGLASAHVNNGGDIALYLTHGESLTCALACGGGRVTIRHADRVRGIATSGWRGRSLSLGIADAVTVLARTAAMADAAATMIANAVDLPGHPGITRRPARQVQADSDLGDRLVTVAVSDLLPAECDIALDAASHLAEALRAKGLIEGAALFLQGRMRATADGILLAKEEERV